jgi:hypothetical protein
MKMTRFILAAACLAVAACATGAAEKEIETHEVVVTRTERAVTEAQVPTPPRPISARPADASSALDTLAAKLCEYVGYADKADPLLQNAAGMTVTQRVFEPICATAPAETAPQR